MRTLAPLLLLLTPAAAAQEQPQLFPTRDVAVTYRIVAGQPAPQGAPQEMRMAYLAAEQKLRVEMPGGTGWSVLDPRAGRLLMVIEPQKLAMELPLRAGAQGGPPVPLQPSASARFTRGGSLTVAGQPCTVWRYEDGPSRGEACVTADGIMLRSSGTQNGRSGTVEATAVAFGAQDPARFRTPAGYQLLQMPEGAPPPR